jgi:uncharacterized MAPEG superfamily protein
MMNAFMTVELKILAWTLVLALVQIIIPAVLRTREFGLPYGASPRDLPAPQPPGLLTGRLIRAQHNLFETLPLFIGAVLILQFLHIANGLTYWGAMLYFWARVAYLPIYGLGISYVRTALWAVSLVGLVMLFIAILVPMA